MEVFLNKLYDYFKEKYDEEKLVQSFIIGNTDFDSISNELELIFSNFFFDRKIDINNNSDIFIIKPENGNISKESIKNLLNYLHTTSQFNNKKIYIIDQCEKLNDYSYNALLKILEEPMPNIYAFLISSNIDSLNNTILSRCQKIFISSSLNNNNFDSTIIELGDILFDKIEKSYKNEISLISNSYDLYSKIYDRDTLKNILLYLIYKYDYRIKELIYNENNDIINTEEINKVSKKMIVLNNNIDRLNYYLNKNLNFDRLLIEIWRCSNENSRD